MIRLFKNIPAETNQIPEFDAIIIVYTSIYQEIYHFKDGESKASINELKDGTIKKD